METFREYGSEGTGATNVIVRPGMTNFIRRVSWPAVFAGVLVVLVTQLMLSLLGIGIGASTIDPLRETNPVQGLGTGSAIWIGISTLISLFLGGWVAGRLSGFYRRSDSALHGVLSWGLATLAMFYLITTTFGHLLGGAVGLVGQSVSALGKATASATALVGDQLNLNNVDWSEIRNEANGLLRDTGKAKLQPEAISRQAKRAGQDIKTTAGAAAQNPQEAGADLNGLLNRIFSRGESTLSAADRNALVNVLVRRTNLSYDEANQTVDRWERTFQEAKAKVVAAKDQAEQKARQAGDAAAKGVSKAALWSFGALLLGMIASVIGGAIGTREEEKLPVATKIATPSTASAA